MIDNYREKHPFLTKVFKYQGYDFFSLRFFSRTWSQNDKGIAFGKTGIIVSRQPKDSITWTFAIYFNFETKKIYIKRQNKMLKV